MKGNLIVIALLASVSALSMASAQTIVHSASPQEAPSEADKATATGANIEAGTAANEADREPLDFAADRMSFDSETNVAIAEGNVFLRRDGRVIHADRIIYDRDEGSVRVEGNIWARDHSGNILTAEHLVINDDFKEGVIENVGLILNDDSRLAARSGKLEGGTRVTMSRTAYSPCAVCNDKGEPINPLWQLRAVTVIHDEDKKRVTYHNATLNAFGVPILWMPYLTHPDPSVHSASGILMPDLEHTSELGFVGKLPYYMRISRDKDATITPWYTTKEGFVLDGEYRQNLGFGKYRVRGSITHVDQRDDTGAKTGQKEFRGHLFSNGAFDLDSLNEPLGGNWSWRYDAGWASDDTYMRRYNITDIDTIKSEVALERFGDRSYGAVTMLGFQGLRVEDVAGLTPFALPMIEYHYVSKPGQMGGTYRFDANALSITRFDGMDSRRLSAGGSWELPYVGESGSIYTLAASLRGDVYNVSSADQNDGAAYAGLNGTKGRFLPQVRLEWRLPMVKETLATRQIIEPILAFVGALEAGNPDAIPNEDSRVIGFDDTNLFASNRFMGYDRWETGSRIDYGVRYGIDSHKLSARFLFGQSYRFFDDAKIPDHSGLAGHWSDFIARAEISYTDFVNLIYRVRLDSKTLNMHRNEIDAIIGPKKFKVTLGYLDLPTGEDDFDTSSVPIKREEVRAGVIYQVAKYWTLSGSLTRDLVRDSSINSRAGVIYEDECLRFGVFYDKRNITDRDIRPNSTILLKISLKNLG